MIFFHVPSEERTNYAPTLQNKYTVRSRADGQHKSFASFSIVSNAYFYRMKNPGKQVLFVLMGTIFQKQRK